MLSWTKDHKDKAKAEGKSLVKLQVQNKHCGGGSFEMSGAKDRDVALIMYKLTFLTADDPRIAKIKELLDIGG